MKRKHEDEINHNALIAELVEKATDGNFEEVDEYLMKGDIDLDALKKTVNTLRRNYPLSQGNIFLWAIFYDHTPVISTLLAKYEDFLYSCECDRAMKDYSACKALIIAATHGHTDTFKYLYKMGTDSHTTSYLHPRNAFISAIENGHLEIVKFLYEKDKNLIDEALEDKLNPAYSAMEGLHKQILFNKATGSTLNPENIAKVKEYCEIVRFLLEKRPKLVSKDLDDKHKILFSKFLKDADKETIQFMLETYKEPIKGLKENDKKTYFEFCCQNPDALSLFKDEPKYINLLTDGDYDKHPEHYTELIRSLSQEVEGSKARYSEKPVPHSYSSSSSSSSSSSTSSLLSSTFSSHSVLHPYSYPYSESSLASISSSYSSEPPVLNPDSVYETLSSSASSFSYSEYVNRDEPSQGAAPQGKSGR